MIIMYTEYDAVTGVLANYARRLNQELGAAVSRLIAPPAADAREAEVELAKNPSPFFFFGHGVRAGLIAQNLVTIDFNKTPHLLSGRVVCATCCHSAAALKSAVGHGATVVGYDGFVAVFLIPPYSAMLEDCLLAGPRELARGGSAADAVRRTRGELRRAARKLIAGPIEDQVYAPFLEMNANLVKEL
ncbi:MAG: hypothetical protein QOJ70_3486 [Acidobacteriota bacterium]|jgi:hypothetical protein|nr:hypothetical protein [Acidobacteriota bacterium]MDT7809673.1 hypothetical protein [Acidobacteriota bacterium]